MELQAYWKAIRRRWWLVLTPVMIVVGYVLATYARPGPVYQVVMRFAAGTTPAAVSPDYDRYYPWLTSEYIANGLADVAETGAFAESLSARLAEDGLDLPPAAIQPAIVTDNAQSFLVVYLTWQDSTQAIAIAEAITAELVENASGYFPQVDRGLPAMRRLDRPIPVQLAPGLRAQLMGPLMKVALALVVGLALALLWHYLDPTIHEAKDVEETGLPVLAEIPRR